MPASVIAEAVKRGETIEVARKRLDTQDHVERNYRGIGIAALAAATVAVRRERTMRRRPVDDVAAQLSATD